MADAAPRRTPADIAVIGGGVGGLVVAYDCARSGLRVAVIEARERLGGLVAHGEIAGIQVDTGAESFSVRGGHVRALAEELGLGDRITAPSGHGAWVTVPGRRKTRTVPLPSRTVLGIPARPWAGDVRTVIGWRGSLRASIDRALPSRVGARAVSVADVVRTRLGRRVLDRLVAPVCLSVHSAPPDRLVFDSAAPGLRDAWRVGGGLTRAVASLAAPSRTGSAVEGLVGGVSVLVSALVDAIQACGGEFLVGRAASRVSARPEGGFEVALAGRGRTEPLLAEDVVLGTTRSEAVHLLSTAAGPLAEPPRGRDIEVVILALAAPSLGANPRGTGVIVAPGTPGVYAKALTHSTAKWGWIADQCGPGRHVVRLSYDSALLVGLEDDAVTALALADASRLLGTALTPDEVLGTLRTSWPEGASALDPTDTRAADDTRRASEGLPGMHLTGAWVAGTGLANVVSQARRVGAAIVADRVRGDP